MKFIDIFRSQVPSILKRLQDIQHEVKVTRVNIEKLAEIEKRLTKCEIGSNRVEKAVDSFGVAMWLKDTEGCFLYANKTCCEKILKCSRMEVLGLKNGDFEKDALAQVCMKSDAEVLRTQKTQRWIEHAIYEDGSHIFVDTVKSLAYDDNMKIIGIVGSAVDITDSISDVIKSRYVKAGSVEVPLNTAISGEQFGDTLDRRNYLEK